MMCVQLGVCSADGEPTPPCGHPSVEGIYMRENIELNKLNQSTIYR
jgi:hypothetical protein